MPKASNLNLRLGLLAGDVTLTVICLVLARLARLAWPLGAELGNLKVVDLSPVVYVLVAALWIVFFNLLSVYSPRKMYNLAEELQSVVMAILTCTVVLAGALYMTYRSIPRLLFIYFFVFDLIALVGFRVILRSVLSVRTGQHRQTARILIIGAGKVGCHLADALAAEHGRPVAQVVGFLDDDPAKQSEAFCEIPVLGTLDVVTDVVKDCQIDEVIFALPLRAHQRLIDMIIDLEKLPVEVKVVPDLFDLAFAQMKVEKVGALPLISLRDSAINGYTRWVKRVFDVAAASSLLLLLAPFLALIGLAIRLDSAGPIIFKQQRVGENGRLFVMYKFRTMVNGAEKQLEQLLEWTPDGKVIHKHANDPRITRLGRFLRRSSMDELPQLLNVLKGEMSLVGPRPELPFIVEQYEPWQRRRLSVPPGITGWWQISGRSDKPMHLHTEDDLYYIQNYSLMLDMEILFKTVGAVVRGRGAF